MEILQQFWTEEGKQDPRNNIYQIQQSKLERENKISICFVFPDIATLDHPINLL